MHLPISDHRMFSAAVADPGRIDLARAALSVCEPEFPDLDVEVYLDRLDQLAAEAQARVQPASGPRETAHALAAYLGKELGYRGNVDAYDDPANSFLNEVLDRRLGLPITLSVLYVEVARRMGLELFGVAFPGHFLVKVKDPPGGANDGGLVLDPFYQGIPLDRDALKRRLDAATGGAMKLSPELLAEATPTQILTRLLRNLKAIYVGRQDHWRALGTVERMLILNPGDLGEIRDRGVLFDRLSCFGPALADFERYVEGAPRADDAAAVRKRVSELRERAQQQN